MRIDLNSDCGESFGEHLVGDDEQIIPLLSSANLACGAHGGDPEVMARAIALASAHKVRIGAHVSYPDRENFGRVVMQLSPDELRHSIAEQLHRLTEAAARAQADVTYVKPHGALYNEAQKDVQSATAVLDAVEEFDAALPVVCMPGSEIAGLAQQRGIAVTLEGFADRAYLASGALAPRSMARAVHTDVDLVVGQALAIARREPVQTLDGGYLRVPAESICIHSDTPGALAMIRAVRAALIAADFEVAC